MQIDLDKIIENKSLKLKKRIPTFLLNYLKKKIHLDELNHILDIYENKYGVDFMNAVVEYFNLNIITHGLDNLPTDESYIFVSNHPLGGLDGICLSSVIGTKYNHHIKYIVNDLLYYLENLKPIFLPVNKHGSQNKETSIMTDEAYTSSNQIITFPAGLCSRKIKGQIIDLKWQKSVIQKSIKYKRNIVPIYFDGKNSTFFYRFANLRKFLGIKFNLEMLFLPDEMFKQKGSTFNVVFGQPIPYTTFDKSKTISEWTEYVRDKVYLLKTK